MRDAQQEALSTDKRKALQDEKAVREWRLAGSRSSA